MDTCVCMAEPLCCSPETVTTLLRCYTPIQNKKLKKNSPHLPQLEKAHVEQQRPSAAINKLQNNNKLKINKPLKKKENAEFYFCLP